MRKPKTYNSRAKYPHKYLSTTLWPDKRDRLSVLRCSREMRLLFRTKFASSHVPAWREHSTDWQAELETICNNYWCNYERDILTPAKMKADARLVAASVQKFQQEIDGLPPLLRIRLEGQDRELFPALRNSLSKIASSCDYVTKEKYIREKPSRFIVACRSLMRFWEKVVGRPFRKSWDHVRTEPSLVSKRGPQEYQTIDMLFVQVALQTIDTKVTFSQIHTAMREIQTDKDQDSGFESEAILSDAFVAKGS